MPPKRKSIGGPDCMIFLGAFVLFALGGTFFQASYRQPPLETQMVRVYCMAVSSGLMDTERAGDLLVQMRKDVEKPPETVVSTSRAVETAIQNLNRVPAVYECVYDVVYYWGMFSLGLTLMFVGCIGPIDYFRTSKKWNEPGSANPVPAQGRKKKSKA